MLVKDLIKILKKHNPNNHVIFYYLENNDIHEINLETILDADNQTEITITHEEV